MTDTEELGAMLSWRRPAGSRTERKFIKKFLLPLGMNIDKYGNLYKKIGDAPILWSCHTDTVHNMGGRQKLTIEDGVFKAHDKQSNCLGADDTAGVWLMKKMIEAERPGLYIFHRAEEIGGGGSLHMAKHNKPLLENIKYAIAFDRKGKTDIITHQGGLRCCSDEFAKSLSAELGMGHTKSSYGTFTDTANYVDLIPECTNIAVGYLNQHFKDENLDSKYLFELREQLMDFNASNLVEKRKKGEIDWEYDFGGYGAWGGHSGDNWRHNHGGPSIKSGGTVYPRWSKSTDAGRYSSSWEDIFGDTDQEPAASGSSTHGDYERMVQLIKDNPRELADFLEEYGVTFAELQEVVWRRNGVIRGARSFKQ